MYMYTDLNFVYFSPSNPNLLADWGKIYKCIFLLYCIKFLNIQIMYSSNILQVGTQKTGRFCSAKNLDDTLDIYGW